MRKQIFKIFTILTLVMVLVMGDFMLLGHGIAIAIYEELETQNKTTNVKNVEFDAYFQEGENKVHTKEALLNEGATLILNVNVKEQGVLSDAKIKIENANFTIQKDRVQNDFVKNIDLDTNEIELNQIIYQNSVTIEVPIEFKKEKYFAEDYFERENTISLEGTYKDTDQRDKNVSGEIKTRVMWTKETDVALSSNIEKYIPLAEGGILLQQKILTQVIDDQLPRKSEKIEVQVPEIAGEIPQEINVLLNGKKLAENQVNYNLENKTVTIENQTDGVWGQATNEYKMIYQYDDVNTADYNISLLTKMTSLIYTQNAIEKQDEQNITITPVGNIVSANKTVNSPIYKGYLYANNNMETIYEEINNIEISKETPIETIEISQEKEVALNTQETEFNLQNQTTYKTTTFDKNNLRDILGEEGNIRIIDEQNNELASFIVEEQEDENIIINYETPVKGIKIITSKPINTGILTIKQEKAIESNTGYTKEQLKQLTKLKTNTKVVTNISEEVAETLATLEDTKTEAKLQVNDNKLSTLQTNENINLLITLNSNGPQYDLYKNPIIDIVFPSELKLKVKSTQQINGENEIAINKIGQGHNANGEQVIHIEFIGEQKTFQNDINEGIQISMTADIEIDKTTPSKISQITMNYTNENRSGETFTTQTPIELNSKYGILTVNKLSNYNNNGEITENIDDKVKIANLDVGSGAKNATQEFTVVNNYESEITGITIIGKIPSIGENVGQTENIETTFETNLKQALSVEGKATKVYYSEEENIDKDSNQWSEQLSDITKVKAFKVELEDNKLAVSESLKISYQLQLPEMLKNNESSYTDISLHYIYGGDEIESNSIIAMQTAKAEQQAPIVSETLEDMTIQIEGRTGGQPLAEGQEVYEGQAIKYKVTITNNSEESINSVVIKAQHTNSIFYDYVDYPYNDSEDPDDIEGIDGVTTKYEENPDLADKQIEIESISAGETKEVYYQISIKELTEESQKTSGEVQVLVDDNIKKEITLGEHAIVESDLKLTLVSGFNEEIPIYSMAGLPIELNIKNRKQEILKDVVIEIPLPEEVYFTTDELDTEEGSRCEFIQYTDKVVKLKVTEINPQETITVNMQLIAEKMPIEINSKNIELLFSAEIGNIKYYSNVIEKTIMQSETYITANQTANIEGEYVKDADELIYTTTIINHGSLEKEVLITDILEDGVNEQESYLLLNGQKVDEEIDQDEEIGDMELQENLGETYNIISMYTKIPANSTVQLVTRTKIDIAQIEGDTISNYVTIKGNQIDITTNKIVYKVKKDVNPDNPNDPNDPNNPNNPNNPDNPDNPNPETTYKIEGKAWVDSNKNGLRETSEEMLSNIEVNLIDEKTGKLIKDEDGNNLKSITDEEGKYSFEKLAIGTYLVIFKYDTNTYRVTQFQTEGVSISTNSDVISKTITIDGIEQQVAVTGNLELKDEDLIDIDAGFIKNEIFDLRLNKSISKIIVQYNKGTIVNQYSNSQLSKIEIDRKQLANSMVIVEYQIQITNEGELAGYVTEIVDYKPNDLSFSSEMNKNWYQSTDGYLHSKELANQIIRPGETKMITLTLVKNMNQNNTGTTINTAEIAKTSNNLSITDIDSTPANKVEGEDDMSTAQVIISIRTGGVGIYLSLIIVIATIIGGGVYLIKKQVLNDEIEEVDLRNK